MEKSFDLIVSGGGFSGVAAALAAARRGLSVMIFDKSNCFGGAAVNCLVNPFMPYWTTSPDTGEKMYLSRGIFSEIHSLLKEYGALRGESCFNEEYLKLILNRMLIKDGVSILFNTNLVDADVSGGNIKSITVVNKSGTQKYYADYFIDATGDGDLAVLCGCPYHIGRAEDGLCQPMTLCFRVCNVDTDEFFKNIGEMNRLYDEFKENGKIKNPREDILAFVVPIDGIIHFNTTRIVKKCPTNAEDITMAEIEAREQAFELFEFLKENFDVFKNAQMLMTASEIGVRESRMIEGDYILTQEDLVSCRKFDDSIAVGNYDIDIHNPEGSGTSHYFFKPGEYYTIPYRCLTPKNTENLLVAGRCISSTHEAQASYRIMPICCTLGQAAGTAAAVAKESMCSVRNIDVSKVQNILKENGAKYN